MDLFNAFFASGRSIRHVKDAILALDPERASELFSIPSSALSAEVLPHSRSGSFTKAHTGPPATHDLGRALTSVPMASSLATAA